MCDTDRLWWNHKKYSLGRACVYFLWVFEEKDITKRFHTICVHYTSIYIIYVSFYLTVCSDVIGLPRNGVTLKQIWHRIWMWKQRSWNWSPVLFLLRCTFSGHNARNNKERFKHCALTPRSRARGSHDHACMSQRACTTGTAAYLFFGIKYILL